MSTLASAAGPDISSARPIRVVVLEPPSDGAFACAVADPGLQVLSRCTDLVRAADAILSLRPDAVLIDLADGLFDPVELVRRVGVASGEVPVVAAGAAGDAVRAFEARAVDFLLKPVGGDRMRQALSRVRVELRASRDALVARRILHLLDRPAAGLKRTLTLKTRGRIAFVDVAAVDYIEAEGNYSVVHVGSVRHIVRRPISRFERDLAGTFVRVHRSALVNLLRVTEISCSPTGAQAAVLAGGSRVPISRRNRRSAQMRVHP